MSVQLPPAFQFSQSSLQDFKDCSRRFQLRYLMEQDWPTPVAEPLNDAEQADLLGRRFHRLIERHYLGIQLDRNKVEAALQGWWDAFLQHPVPNLPEGVRKPEVHTSSQVHGQRMVAAFDLLAYNPGGDAVIVDWKTTRRRSSRNWLDRRLQTIIYPLLLVESSKRLLGYQLNPEQVRLVYWFANAPTESEVFQYSATRYEQDQKTLALLLDQLLNTQDQVWPLTPDTALCRLCQYRSLCDRGTVAGSADDIDTESPETADINPVNPVDDFVL